MKDTSLFENKLREQLNMEIERNKAISRLAFNVIVGDFVFFSAHVASGEVAKL